MRIAFIFIVMLCVSCMYSEQHKKEDYKIHAEVDNVALDSIKIINRIYEDERLQGLISFNDSNEIIINTGTEAIKRGIKTSLIEKFGLDEKEIFVELEPDESKRFIKNIF